MRGRHAVAKFVRPSSTLTDKKKNAFRYGRRFQPELRAYSLCSSVCYRLMFHSIMNRN